MPSDKEIYLAFSTVFTGNNSAIRKTPAIKRLVRSSKNKPEVAQFFQKNNDRAGGDVIYQRLKLLLEQRVFDSYAHAKVKFPGLFITTKTQENERTASEAAAATDHARAIEGALLCDQVVSYDTGNDSDESFANSDATLSDNVVAPAQGRLSDPDIPSGPPIPKLFPICLPFITGHRIIVELQTILEQACFDFARNTMPEVLESKGWSCSEAVELNNWVKVFRQQEQNSGQHLFQATPTGVAVDHSFYKSLCDIRHTAVHRLPMTAAGIDKCLRDGEVLVALLDDNAAASRLSAMRKELQRVTAEMEDHKGMLETKLSATLERIAAERAELDRQEKEAIDGMVQADEEYQLYAGASLEKEIGNRDAEMSMGSEEDVFHDTEAGDGVDDGGACLEDPVEDFEGVGFLLTW